MENKCPDETSRMRGMNLNLCILRMLEDTFSLGAAQMHFLKLIEYRICLDYSNTLTHCRRNRLSQTIYWKSPISILGTSGWDLHIPRENG